MWLCCLSMYNIDLAFYLGSSGRWMSVRQMPMLCTVSHCHNSSSYFIMSVVCRGVIFPSLAFPGCQSSLFPVCLARCFLVHVYFHNHITYLPLGRRVTAPPRVYIRLRDHGRARAGVHIAVRLAGASRFRSMYRHRSRQADNMRRVVPGATTWLYSSVES